MLRQVLPLILLLALVVPLQVAHAAPEGYSEHVRLQAVEGDVYAELDFQGEALKLASELQPASYPALAKVSLWAVSGKPPETMVWTDLPRLPQGVTLLVELSSPEGEAQNQLSNLIEKVESLLPVKFLDVTGLWEGLGERSLKVYFSPVDFNAYLKAYWKYVPTNYGGFTRLADPDLYKYSSFTMLGVEFDGGSPALKLRLVYKAEASTHQFKALKASVRECFNYGEYLKPSPYAESSTAEVRVIGGVITAALLPNLTVKPGGVLEGNFKGVESFPDVYAAYLPGFQDQPYLKVVKVVDRATWGEGDLVQVTITVSNLGSGAALNVSVDDSESLKELADYVTLQEGSASTFIPNIAPGRSETFSYVVKVEASPPGSLVSLKPARVLYFDESLLNLYEASSNSVTVGLGVPIASLIPILEADRVEVKAGETVNATLSLVNIGSSTAYNVTILAQTAEGEGWLTRKVSEIPPTSTATVTIPIKVCGVKPVCRLGSTISISYFTMGLEGAVEKAVETPNSVNIHLKSRNLPKLSLSKEIDRKTCKVGDSVKVRLSLVIGRPLESLTLLEMLPEGVAYVSGDFTPALPSRTVKREITSLRPGEALTLTYTVRVEKPEVLVFPPTLALIRGPPNLPPLPYYASNTPVASAALSLTKEVKPLDEEGKIQVVVSALNGSQAGLSNIRLEDRLPEGVELVEGELQAEASKLGPGEVLHLTYFVRLSKPSKTFTFPGVKASYKFLNSTFSQSSRAVSLEVSLPKVALTKSVSFERPLAGEPVKVDVRLVNEGASTILNVKLKDSLPEGLKLKPGEELKAEAPILKPGEELILTYTFTSSEGAFKLPRAEATYSYLGLPLKAWSNIEEVSFAPKLLLSKSVEPANVKPNQAFTVKIIIKNLGSKLEALNVEVLDGIPSYARLVEGSPKTFIPKLPPGGVSVLTYKLRVEKPGSYQLPQPSAAYTYPAPGNGKVTLIATGKVTVNVAAPQLQTLLPPFLPYAIVGVLIAAIIILIIRRRLRAAREEEEFL